MITKCCCNEVQSYYGDEDKAIAAKIVSMDQLPI